MLVKLEHAARARDDDIPDPGAIQLGRIPAPIDSAERLDDRDQIGELAVVKQQY
jgi:hypothetical protein